MSTLVTEPNRRPSTPAFWVSLTVVPPSFSPWACDSASLAAAAFSSSTRLASNSFLCGFGGAAGAAGRDQEVTGVTVLDLDDFAEVAEVDDLVQKNDLHGVSLLRLLCWSLYGTMARKRARLIAVLSWRW